MQYLQCSPALDDLDTKLRAGLDLKTTDGLAELCRRILAEGKAALPLLKCHTKDADWMRDWDPVTWLPWINENTVFDSVTIADRHDKSGKHIVLVQCTPFGEKITRKVTFWFSPKDGQISGAYYSPKPKEPHSPDGDESIEKDEDASLDNFDFVLALNHAREKKHDFAWRRDIPSSVELGYVAIVNPRIPHQPSISSSITVSPQSALVLRATDVPVANRDEMDFGIGSASVVFFKGPCHVAISKSCVCIPRTLLPLRKSLLSEDKQRTIGGSLELVKEKAPPPNVGECHAPASKGFEGEDSKFRQWVKTGDRIEKFDPHADSVISFACRIIDHLSKTLVYDASPATLKSDRHGDLDTIFATCNTDCGGHTSAFLNTCLAANLTQVRAALHAGHMYPECYDPHLSAWIPFEATLKDLSRVFDAEQVEPLLSQGNSAKLDMRDLVLTALDKVEGVTTNLTTEERAIVLAEKFSDAWFNVENDELAAAKALMHPHSASSLASFMGEQRRALGAIVNKRRKPPRIDGSCVLVYLDNEKRKTVTVIVSLSSDTGGCFVITSVWLWIGIEDPSEEEKKRYDPARGAAITSDDDHQPPLVSLSGQRPTMNIVKGNAPKLPRWLYEDKLEKPGIVDLCWQDKFEIKHGAQQPSEEDTGGPVPRPVPK